MALQLLPVLSSSPVCAAIKLLTIALPRTLPHLQLERAQSTLAGPAPETQQLQSQDRSWAKGTAPSPGMAEVILLWEGGAGMMPDKPWWKEQENEKNFPALHKKSAVL